MSWLLALDIGNSSVVAAAAIDGGPASIVPLGYGTGNDAKSWMPAAVFLTSNTVYTGQQAIDHAADAPSAFAHSPKRFVGSDNQRAVELFATIIEKVRRSALMYLGNRDSSLPDYPTKLILTHPAAWPSSARTVLIDAAKSAGFDEDTIELVSEPIAAAHSVSQRHRTGKLFVLDVGGGTCDVAVVDMDTASPRVLADGGENTIGGNNFDLAMIGLMEARTIDEFGELPEELDSAEGQLEFQSQAKKVREALSESPDASFTVDGEELLITRDEFEEAIADDIERVRSLITDKTSLLGEAPGMLSGLLVGGTVRTPAISRVVQQSMEVLPIEEPITAVALGAAEYGKILLAQTNKSASGSALPQPAGNADNASPKKRALSQKAATRIGAVVAGLVIAAGMFYFVGNGSDESAEQAAPPAEPSQSDTSAALHTYPNVSIGDLKATELKPDAPAFKDGYFSCEPMIDAVKDELDGIKGFPQATPDISGFAGTSECRFSGEDSTPDGSLSIRTFTPAGTSMYVSAVNPSADSRIENWYEKEEGDIDYLEPAQVFVYVRDFGWLIVESASEEIIDKNVLQDVAAALDEELQLQRP
ncbi:Hsp70 family protein [uncultured Corynebacterium sp.]|uniref:Hsp70 family protein n=1 Tax=uncultured Corynebacterium sp. TaxID=159447 RepID=UPI002598BF88|nr:Hsp70 family protein [uncultured Corynebacterium sp.]